METAIVVGIVAVAAVLMLRLVAAKAGLGREKPDCGCGTCATKRKEKF